MKGLSTKRFIILGILFLLLIAGSSIIFIVQMNHMIEQNMMNTINELGEHDLVSIQNFLERNWNDLSSIQNRMVVYDCQTIQETQERMNLERASSDFHTLYLVDENGNVYTDRYMIYSREEMDIASCLEAVNGDEIAVRYDFQTTTVSPKEMVLYAIRLDNYTVDGVKFVALAGISAITRIQERLALYSFYKNGESRGYTSVVNLNGDFIVNIRRTTSLNQRENLYDMLDSGTTSAEWTSETVKAHMINRERFSLNYRDTDGVDKLLYFIPVESGVNWYLTMMVERSVFTDLSKTFIVSSISMVTISVVVSLTAMLLLMQLQRKALTADAKAKAKSEFLSSMSHEIRTPLNGVVGSLRLIRTHIENQDTEQAAEWLDKADSTAQYLLTLISDFLDMSKLQDGKLNLVTEAFSLDSMLTSIQTIQQSNAESRGVELIVEKDLPLPWVMGDETRIEQVIINIVGNAVKFTPAGGTIRLTAAQEQTSDRIVTTKLICADTGVGMSAQFQERIWDSFSQERNKNSDGTRGTGLGMAISKSIVDAMHGEISVSSELGKGSVFTVVLPLEIADAPAEPAPEALPEQAPESAASEKPLKLLVAEDNELNAEILLEILTDEGFEVLHAVNGQIAVELFDRSAPGEIDAILMDMQMPVMDGCQAVRNIRALKRSDAKTVTIFACTANAFQEDRERALNSGMNDFLTKPIDVDVLLEKLSEQQKKKRGSNEA